MAMKNLASQKIVDAFNEQIGHELGASNQYIAIAAYFSGRSLAELAKFFYRQAEEEREHAMKFVSFLIDVEGTVKIPVIEAPRHSFASAEEAVALSLEWEKKVTEQIYGLVDVARGDSNYIALRFLDWFVTEQLEEVTSMSTLLDLVRMAGPQGVLWIEDYLARSGGVAGANPLQGGEKG